MTRAKLPRDDKQWAKLAKKITSGRDIRSAVIVGGSLLDATLEEMLASWLLPGVGEQLFDPNSGAVATFGAKKQLAFALALIDDREKRVLQAIASIRNVFAHHLLDATFDHPNVAKPLAILREFRNADSTVPGRKVFTGALIALITSARIRTLEPRTPEAYRREVEARVAAEWVEAAKRYKSKNRRQPADDE